METQRLKFLIIRLSSIGDILLTTPLLRILRKKYPKAQIDFIVKKQYYECIHSNPYLDNIYQLDTFKSAKELKILRTEIQQKKYDWIIDLHGNFRSIYLRSGYRKKQILTFKKHKLIRFLLVRFGINLYQDIPPVYLRYIQSSVKLGLEYDDMGLDYALDEDAVFKIRELLSQRKFNPNKKTICIAPGASFFTKRWPSDKYAKVAKRLQDEKDIQIILVGGETDKPYSQDIANVCSQPIINFTGELSLMETACVLSFADLVLTNDTGVMHLSNSLNKQTIAIFGPTVKELGFYPLEKISTVIENSELTCRPCTHMGSNKCPQKHFKCMRDITTDAVSKVVSYQIDALS